VRQFLAARELILIERQQQCGFGKFRKAIFNCKVRSIKGKHLDVKNEFLIHALSNVRSLKPKEEMLTADLVASFLTQVQRNYLTIYSAM
jgi:hypothetical protein